MKSLRLPSNFPFLMNCVAGLLVFVGWSSRANAAATNTNQTNAATSSSPSVLTLGLDRIPALQMDVWGNPLWQYVASFLYILLAFGATKVLETMIQVYLRRRTTGAADRLGSILELLRGPIKVVIFVILLHIGLRVLAWPEWAATFISNGLKVVVACSITYVALKLVDMGIGRWQRRAEIAEGNILDVQLFPVIRKTLKIFVLVIAFLVTSQNMGMNITGLIASLSIGGLAVGLAAQDTLANLFGAVAIFADKPFRVGDRIQLDAIDGMVEAIGLRSTRIRHLDGYLVTVPNKTIANANITNISKRPNIKTVMNIGVTYDTPADKVERAMDLIRETLRPHPKTADLIISFNKFESSSLNILVVHWWDSLDMKEYLSGFQKLNLELKRRFDAEGINFAFPSQTVYLKQEGSWHVAPAPNGNGSMVESGTEGADAEELARRG